MVFNRSKAEKPHLAADLFNIPKRPGWRNAKKLPKIIRMTKGRPFGQPPMAELLIRNFLVEFVVENDHLEFRIRTPEFWSINCSIRYVPLHLPSSDEVGCM